MVSQASGDCVERPANHPEANMPADLLQHLIVHPSQIRENIPSASSSATAANPFSGTHTDLHAPHFVACSRGSASCKDTGSKYQKQEIDDIAIPEAIPLLPNMMSMDDFIASHAGHAAPSRGSKAKTSTQQQLPKSFEPITFPTAPEAQASAGAQPVKLPGVNTNYVKDFNELCQKHGFKHETNFIEPQSYKFQARHVLLNAATFKVPEENVEVDGVKIAVMGHGVVAFETTILANSKREAKERAAKAGLDFLRSRLSSEKSQSQSELCTEVPYANGDQNENWIGMLIEYCNAMDAPAPSFDFYGIGLAFACEVFVPVVLVGKRTSRTFGSKESPLFRSKQTAKMNAAYEAVKFLLENRLLSNVGGGPLRKKERATFGAPPPELRGEEPASGGVAEPQTPLGSQTVNSGHSDLLSYLSVAMQMADSLNCSKPEFVAAPEDPAAPGLYSCHARFSSHDDSLLGDGMPVASVHHVNGRKQAKEESARIVVDMLGAVRRKREEELERYLQTSMQNEKGPSEVTEVKE